LLINQFIFGRLKLNNPLLTHITPLGDGKSGQATRSCAGLVFIKKKTALINRGPIRRNISRPGEPGIIYGCKEYNILYVNLRRNVTGNENKFWADREPFCICRNTPTRYFMSTAPFPREGVMLENSKSFERPETYKLRVFEGFKRSCGLCDSFLGEGRKGLSNMHLQK